MGNASKSLAIVLVTLFLTSLIALPFSTVKANSTTDDWPMFRSGPSHDGVGTSSLANVTVDNPVQLSKTNHSKGYWRISFLIRFVIMDLRSALSIYLSRMANWWSFPYYTVDSGGHFYNNKLHCCSNRFPHMAIG